MNVPGWMEHSIALVLDLLTSPFRAFILYLLCRAFWDVSESAASETHSSETEEVTERKSPPPILEARNHEVAVKSEPMEKEIPAPRKLELSFRPHATLPQPPPPHQPAPVVAFPCSSSTKASLPVALDGYPRSDVELAVMASKRLETILQLNFGGTGKGLNTKLRTCSVDPYSSVAYYIHYLARIRNQLVQAWMSWRIDPSLLPLMKTPKEDCFNY